MLGVVSGDHLFDVLERNFLPHFLESIEQILFSNHAGIRGVQLLENDFKLWIVHERLDADGGWDELAVINFTIPNVIDFLN